MNRMTATILSLALAASAAWAADPPSKEAPPLPAPVVAAENTMNAAVDKARAAYLKSIEAEVKKLQATLEKEKATATRNGNLDLALAIKAKQDALTLEAVVAEAGKKLSADELLGGDASVNLLNDKKIIVNGSIIFQFNSDGTFSRNKAGNAADMSGKWTFDGKTLKILPKSNSFLTFTYDKSTKTFKSEQTSVTDAKIID